MPKVAVTIPRNLPTPTKGDVLSSVLPVGALVLGTYLVGFLLSLLSSGGADELTIGQRAWQLPLMFGSMAWHGAIRLGGDFTEYVNASMHVVVPTLLIILVAAVVAVAHVAERWWPSARMRRVLVRAGVSAILGAAVLLIMAALGTVSYTEDLYFFTLSVSVTAVTARTFFSALLFVFVGAVSGALSARPRGRRLASLGVNPGPRAASVLHALDTVVVHFVAWTVAGAAVLLTGGVVLAIREETPAVVFIALAYLGGAGVVAGGLGHWGGLSARVDGSSNLGELIEQFAGFGLPIPGEGGIGRTFSLFSNLPWYSWGLFLISLALMALVSIRVFLRRAPGAPLDLSRVWLAPVLFGVFWLVVPRLLFSAGLRASGELEGYGVDVTARAGMGWWLPLVMVFWGFVIEACSFYLAPRLIPLAPRLAARFGGRGIHPGWGEYFAGHGVQLPSPPPDTRVDQGTRSTTTPPAASTADIEADWPASAPVSESTGATVATAVPSAPLAEDRVLKPREPMDPQRKRVVVGGLAGAGVLIVLVVAAVIVVGALNSSRYSPEREVEAYFAALSEGDVQRAIELGRIDVPNKGRVLLTPEVYSEAEGRPTDLEILDVTVDEDTAVVNARYAQDGSLPEQQFALRRTGKTMLFFDTWQLEPVQLGTTLVRVASASGTVEFNGVEVDISTPQDPFIVVAGEGDGIGPPPPYVKFPAFPGTYSVTVPEAGKYFEEVSLQHQVIGLDSLDVSDDMDFDAFDEVFQSAGGDIAKDIQKAVNGFLDTCAKKHDVDTCPFPAADLYDEEIKDVTIAVSDYPELDPASLPQVASTHPQLIGMLSHGTVTLEGTLAVDRFFEDKGDPTQSTEYVSEYGWRVLVAPDKVTVSFEEY